MIKSIQGTISQTWNPYVTSSANPEMMGSEFGVLSLGENETFAIEAQQEYVFCLNCGAVEFCWDGQSAAVSRKSCFYDDPYVLHVCTGTRVSIRGCGAHAEVNVAGTANDRRFACRLYGPEDLLCRETADAKKLDGKVKRIKRVFFDRSVCPQTNLFCGEVVNYPGCWACFPPHLHQEPEIYYYKFFPQQGYGFSEFGSEAIKVTNRSVTCNPGGNLHSQATAPGYAGYIMWTQRLQDNGKDIVYTLDERHAWLDEDDVKIFPELREQEK